ncbi:MAG: Ig-like domain-containing protein [Pirellulales bacterium]
MDRKSRQQRIKTSFQQIESLEPRRLLAGEPLAVNDQFVVSEDSPLQIAVPGVLFNDLASAPLSAAVATPPQHGELKLAADGSFHYQPAADFFGEDSFTYQASDGKAASNPATVKITVLPVADGPVTPRSDVYVTREGEPLAVEGLGRLRAVAGFNDAAGLEADPLANSPYQLQAAVNRRGVGETGWAAPWSTGQPNLVRGETVVEGDGAVLLAPTSGTARLLATPLTGQFGYDVFVRPANGSRFVVYTMDSALGDITEISGGPVILFREDGQIVAIDGGNDVQTGFSWHPDQWTHLSVSADTGNRTYQLQVDDQEFAPPQPLHFRGVASQIDKIFLQSELSGPGVYLDALKMFSGAAMPGVLGNDENPDALPLAAEVVNPPAHAAAFKMNADGTFSYTPAPGFVGNDAFSYRVNDGAQLSEPATVTIVVQDVLHPPTAVDDAYDLTEGSPLAVTIAAEGVLKNDSDSDGDALTAQLVAAPSHGQLELHADGTFVYTPAPGFHGTDAFSYRANDGGLNSSAANVQLTVAPFDPRPVATNDSYTVAENGLLDVGLVRTVKNISTGWNDDDAVKLVDGAADIEYRIGSGGTGGQVGQIPNVLPGNNPFGSYVPDDASQGSRWLAVITNPPLDVTVLPGTYDWETHVDLTGWDPATATLSALRYAADDTLLNVAINGAVVFTPGPNGGNAFRDAGDVGLGAFKDGINTIRFRVLNNPGAPTPMGLRVEGEVRAQPIPHLTVPSGPLANDRYPVAGPAAGFEVNVPATSNLWLAGMPDGSTASGLDSAPAQSPVQVLGVPVTGGDSLQFQSSGGASSGAQGGLLYPADGSSVFVQHGSGAENGLANIVAPLNSLVGVFLSDDSPAGLPTPWWSLDFRSNSGNVPNGTDFVDLQPLLRQPFFIGDGSATDGTPQLIRVPQDATRLFLGVMDGNASFNNLGAFQVEVSSPAIIPTKLELVEGPAHGDLDLRADGSFRYIPALDYHGADLFRYKISSRYGDSAIATVSLDVQPSALAPLANDDHYQVAQSVELRSQEMRVVQNLATGIDDRTGTKLEGFAFDDTYRIGAGSAPFYPGSVPVAMPGDPPYPDMLLDSSSADSRWIGVTGLTEGDFNNTPANYFFDASVDLTGFDPATATIQGFRWAADSYLVGVYVNGELAYAGAPHSRQSFTPAVDIGQGLFHEGLNTVRLLVSNDNLLGLRVEGLVEARPLAPPGAPSVLANDSDPFGQALAAELVGGPAHGTLQFSSDGRFRYTPSPEFVGVDQFTYRVSNGRQTTSPATVFIEVTPAQNDPRAAEDQYFVAPGATLAAGRRALVKDISTGYDDSAGEKLEFLAPDLDYRLVGGDFDGQPPFVMQSPYPTPYLPDDGSPNSRWILPAPAALPGDYLFETKVDLTGYDPASAVLRDVRFSADDVLKEIRINGVNVLARFGGGIELWHQFSELGQGRFVAGENTIQMRVVNGAGSYNAMALRLEGRVEAIPQPSLVGVLANDEALRGMPLTAELETAPQHGALTLFADGSFQYTPAAGFSGYDSFTYRANDGVSSSVPANVFLRVGVPPLVGDANGDGRVDLTDFGLLKANFGSGTTRAKGDFNGDQKVDLTDFGILKQNFGVQGSRSLAQSDSAGDLAWQAAVDWALAATGNDNEAT